jgi:CheY-like chemotaxis protein
MSARRRRVLVIEDNVLNMELVRDLLGALGCDVEEATSAETGIRLAIDDPPDLILMDIRLPGLDGYAAVKRLKENPRTESVPVVALTAQAMKDDESVVRAAGFDDYVSKPISVRAFPEMIARHLPPEATRG